MIREIKHENSTLYFVADDLGIPFSPGYLTREQAEQVAELIKSSDNNATLPKGIDVESILADYR